MDVKELFNELSDFYWSAGWMIDLDVRLWKLLQDQKSYLRKEHRLQLQEAADAGKWCWWPDHLEEEEEIDLEGWKKKRLR